MSSQPYPIPLGTLVVNCLGGFLVGVALVVLQRYPHELWRMALVTGFLGGLTTFSAFSGESLSLLMQGRWLWAVIHTAAHVIGALLCAVAGAALVRCIWAWGVGA